MNQLETPEDILYYIKCKSTENYIQYYKDIVPENLCNKLINQDFNYQPSAIALRNYTTKILLHQFWIRKDNVFYNDIKECI